ncbi:hypothetical protein D3C81_1966700 [compost metagenome]
MAEIITDILGAERRGRYATRSMETPKTTVMKSTRGMATNHGKLAIAKIIK